MNIEHLKLPSNLPQKEWDVLFSLTELNAIPGIAFSQSYFDAVPHWCITEELGDFKFIFHRNKATNQRITEQDYLGLIGFSSLNVLDDRVYLTEGVSDFITVKLLNPKMNVLGLTTLSGSIKAKKLICSLFNKICIISDNDTGKGVNTGISNVQRMRKFYTGYGKQVKIKLPSTGFKDITDEFIFELKQKMF